jgi:hypothetical protein
MSTQGRVTSTFEACHLLLGLPTVRISRQFVWVHTGKPETYQAFVQWKCWREILENPEELLDPSPPKLIQRYVEWRRQQVAADAQVEVPVEGKEAKPEKIHASEITLFDFAASYDVFADSKGDEKEHGRSSTTRAGRTGFDRKTEATTSAPSSASSLNRARSPSRRRRKTRTTRRRRRSPASCDPSCTRT